MADEYSYQWMMPKSVPGVYTHFGFMPKFSLLEAVKSFDTRLHYAHFNQDTGLYEDDFVMVTHTEPGSGFGNDVTYVNTKYKTILIDEDIPIEYQLVVSFKQYLSKIVKLYYLPSDADEQQVVNKLNLQVYRDTGRAPKFYIPLKEGIVVMANKALEIEVMHNPATNQRKFAICLVRPNAALISAKVEKSGD